MSETPTPSAPETAPDNTILDVDAALAAMSGDILGVADANSGAAARMSFVVGGIGLLFPRNDGREVIATPPASRIPNTASWLRGLANVRGELVPVVDTAAALGAAPGKSAPYLLIFGRGENAIGLMVDGLPRLFDFNTAQQLPELPQLPAVLEGRVTAAYEQAGRVWLDIDLESWFEHLAQHAALN